LLYIIISFSMCSLFWFSCPHLQSDWLVGLLSERLFESWRLSPQNQAEEHFSVLFAFVFVLFCYVFVPSLTEHILLWQQHKSYGTM